MNRKVNIQKKLTFVKEKDNYGENGEYCGEFDVICSLDGCCVCTYIMFMIQNIQVAK